MLAGETISKGKTLFTTFFFENDNDHDIIKERYTLFNENSTTIMRTQPHGDPTGTPRI